MSAVNLLIWIASVAVTSFGVFVLIDCLSSRKKFVALCKRLDEMSRGIEGLNNDRTRRDIE